MCIRTRPSKPKPTQIDAKERQIHRGSLRIVPAQRSLGLVVMLVRIHIQDCDKQIKEHQERSDKLDETS